MSIWEIVRTVIGFMLIVLCASVSYVELVIIFGMLGLFFFFWGIIPVLNRVEQ